MVKKIKKKKIILPGAYKSGTSTFFNLITRHSMIITPKINRSQFFALEEDIVRENLGWYKEKHYSKKEKGYFLDRSGMYLSSKRAPHLIKKYVKYPKILVILRDPIKRAYSGYLHMYKKVPCADKRSFDEIIDSIDGTDINKTIRTENQNIEDNIRMGKINEHYVNKTLASRKEKKDGVNFKYVLEDPLFHYKHLQHSLYRMHIRRFKEEFDEIKIIFLEELIDKTEKVMKYVLDFLDLNYEKELFELPHKNVTKIPRNKLARGLLYVNKKIVPSPLNKKIQWQLKDKSPLYKPKPKLSKELYEKGRGLLKKEYDYWISEHPKLEEYWTY